MLEPRVRTRRRSPSAVDSGLFREIVETSLHGVIVVDRDDKIVLVNREVERLFGQSRHDLIGERFEMLVAPELRAQLPEFHTMLAVSGDDPSTAPRLELLGLCRDGSLIPVEIAVSAIPTKSRSYTLISVVDISERQLAEQRLRVAFEASPHGMLMIDPEGRIVLANRETERVFGYSRDELLGQSVERLVPVDVRERHPQLRQAFCGESLARAVSPSREFFGQRRDGSRVPVEVALNRIETGDGVFVLASVIDISLRKKAEEQLRRSNEDLERFAYIASHDLQEPLRTITSFVQLIARRYRDELDADGREFVDFAVSGAVGMKRLIEDLLAFARVGPCQSQTAVVVIEASLRKALAHLQAAITEARAIVTHDPLPRVIGDAGQIEQLLTNLLGNALKFRTDEAPRVHISAKREGQDWQFSVRDNGIGIDEQYLDRIFMIFQRLHARDEYPGTGVGLAVCKKIVEHHGGRIWADSRPGVGSTFYFTLPASALAE